MFFDEAKREKLIGLYRQLPEKEQTAYRVLAVVFVPLTVNDLASVLNIVLSPPERNKWSVRQCSAMLENWRYANLAEKCLELRYEGWACSALLTEVAAREALDRGEYDEFDRAAEQTLHFSLEEQANAYHSVTRFLRVTRKALYKGDAEGYRHLAAATLQGGRSRYAGEDRLNILLHTLGNPLDMRRLSSLPPRLGGSAFDAFLRMNFDAPDLFQKILAAFEAYCGKNAKDFELLLTWAGYAALAGRMDEAGKALSEVGNAEKYSVAALCAIARGERDRALELYEEGLKLLRKSTGRRKVSYASWMGIFYPVLLLGEGAPPKKIQDYADAALRGFEVALNPVSYSMLLCLLLPGTKNQKLFEISVKLLSKPERCIDAFFFILCAYWIDTGKARQFQFLAETAYQTLTGLGFNFLAAELAVLIRELWPGFKAKGERLPAPAHPLKDLISRQTDWERSLSALSGIGVKEGAVSAKGAKRFVWEISWRFKEKTLAYAELTPMEQTLQASGWSKGKNVALKRLYRKADTVSGMTDQDHRAASAIREERGYYETSYYIDVPQALEALAGHPCVFRAEDGGRVEIVLDEPQLTAAAEAGTYRLKLSPFPADGAVPQRAVREDGPNCLRVTRFEERHVKIAEILGVQGLAVPERAKDTLLKALGSLASVVTVHSDIEGVESSAQQVEADARVYMQLQPSDDAEKLGLDVSMVARPLGPNSVPCRPGVGGGVIFGLAGGKRLQARRELETEKDAFMLAVHSCPALADAEQTAHERWLLPDPELALEFLTQVQALGDSVVVEWPKGQELRVKRQISMSSMNVAARGAQDWFALSGALTVDEDLVLSMKDLMELLKVGHGRFLPIGEGQFIALTQEFRKRLETLAALAEPRGDELRVSPLAVGMLAPLVEDAGSFEGNPEWDRWRTRISEAADLSPVPPSTFRGELRNYQLEGFRWLARLAHWGAGACLADDMGLGKTIQALALLAVRGGGGPALVVAPTSVCSNWLTEANRFAPTLNMKELRYGDRQKILEDLNPLDVVVTTYGLLQNEIGILSAVHWHTIVLDEAQAIKNMGTKRSVAAMKLAGDFRMATTGTPIENHLSELWNLFRFLNPHFLGSFESFNRRFAVPIERDGDKEARSRLKKVIQPFILRRNKQQVLEELPPKTEVTLRVEMKAEEQAFYEALRRDSVEKLSAGDAADQRFRIFAELMRLRRACCNAVLAMPEEQREAGKKFPSAKLEAFSEILGELRENGHKALVFSQFVDHLTIIRRYLDEEKVAYQYLDGSTPPQERVRRVAAFQSGEGDCFLISLKAGGTGLNLTAADYVIHMDPWWNPAVEEQASDRAHRIGQDRPVTVYRIVAKDTIEEKIVDLHAWKRDLAESLLDESEAPLRLSAEEMLELIREAR